MGPHGITEQDLADLIPRFYGRVRADEQLGLVFAVAIPAWPLRLPKLVDFWSSFMRASERYIGSPDAGAPPPCGVKTPAMFDRWRCPRLLG